MLALSRGPEQTLYGTLENTGTLEVWRGSIEVGCMCVRCICMYDTYVYMYHFPVWKAVSAYEETGTRKWEEHLHCSLRWSKAHLCEHRPILRLWKSCCRTAPIKPGNGMKVKGLRSEDHSAIGKEKDEKDDLQRY